MKFLTKIFFRKTFHLRCLTDSEYAYGLLNLLWQVLRGIHEKVDICQTDYSIHSKLRIFCYSEVIPGRVLLFPSFFCSNVLDNKCYKQKCCVLFFTHIKTCTGMCVCDCMHHMHQMEKTEPVVTNINQFFCNLNIYWLILVKGTFFNHEKP